MAELPETPTALAALRQCAETMRSPTSPALRTKPLTLLLEYPFVATGKPVPSRSQYFDAIEARLIRKGFTVDRKTLWVKSGVATC